MKEKTVILLAEDDHGHATLTRMSLRRAGLFNDVVRFKDGQETLDFLFARGEGPSRQPCVPYLLLLDLRMPKVGGISVLRQIKQDEQLRKMPVVVLTTTYNPHEIEECSRLECSHYIVKPTEYEEFVEAMKEVEPFLDDSQATAATKPDA